MACRHRMVPPDPSYVMGLGETPQKPTVWVLLKICTVVRDKSGSTKNGT